MLKGYQKLRLKFFTGLKRPSYEGDVDAKSYFNNLCKGTNKDTEKATYWLQKSNRNGSKEG